MLINLIGSEGFIGKAIKKNSGKLKLKCWSHSYENVNNRFNLFEKDSWKNLLNSSPETVLLLSWPGLPNYNKNYHLTRNLPFFIEFVEALINAGCKNIIVSGTCYEYGNVNGCLEENQKVDPNNAYAIAKDALRRNVQYICEKNNVRWVWVRLFYPFGLDQNPLSLFPSLVKAINENKKEFNISSGNQKRDFISSDKVALNLLFLCINLEAKGIYNCGSGMPLSIYEFVKKIVKENNSSIFIKKGVYPDRIDEPKEFWADMRKFNLLLKNSNLFNNASS